MRKLKEKDYVEYSEYKRNKLRVDSMIYHGWELIYGKSVLKILIGILLVIAGVITLPFPTGSIVLISVGISLMSSGGLEIIIIKKSIYWEVRTRLNMRKNK